MARQKLRVKTVRVVNIEHDSREDGKSGERFILSGGRAKISVKREIGRGGRGERRSEAGGGGSASFQWSSRVHPAEDELCARCIP